MNFLRIEIILAFFESRIDFFYKQANGKMLQGFIDSALITRYFFWKIVNINGFFEIRPDLIKNRQLVKCCHVLILQQQPFHDHRTAVSQTAVEKDRVLAVVSLNISALKTNVFCRVEVCLSNEV